MLCWKIPVPATNLNVTYTIKHFCLPFAQIVDELIFDFCVFVINNPHFQNVMNKKIIDPKTALLEI